jgi:hypothetical protein
LLINKPATRWLMLLRDWRVLLTALVLVLVVLISWLFLQNKIPKQVVQTAQLDALHAACVADMIANTCKVMGTGSMSNASTLAPDSLVFIAGVGSIAAADYLKMHEAGDAMCSVIRGACEKQWDSSQCMTARKVYAQIK